MQAPGIISVQESHCANFLKKKIDNQIRDAGKLGVAKETKEIKESPNFGQIISGVNFIPK